MEHPQLSGLTRPIIILRGKEKEKAAENADVRIVIKGKSHIQPNVWPGERIPAAVDDPFSLSSKSEYDS
jgi:hypothetical protein